MGTFIDEFARADNADLGTDYTLQTGGSALKIVSNAVRCTTPAGSDAQERYTGIPAGTAQYVEITIKTFTKPTTDIYCWGFVRGATAANTSYNIVASTVPTRTTYIQKRLSGANTEIATDTTYNWVATDVMLGVVDGSVVTIYRNNVAVTNVTDTAISGPGYTGLAIWLPDAGGTNVEIDTFSCGNTEPLPRSVYQAVNRGAFF